MRPPHVILAVLIAAILMVAGVGFWKKEDSSTDLPSPSSSPSVTQPRVTGTPQPTPATVPTPQPISDFELRVLDFMEAWHTEDPELREQKLSQISTSAFQDANPWQPLESSLHASVLNRHEDPRPMIISEPAIRDDSVRYVSIGNVIIEKYDGETFVTGFTAPTLSTVWVKQDDKWLIDSQTYPFD